MIPSDNDPVAGILASDGSTVHRLSLRPPSPGSAPVLANAAGATFQPWEVDVLQWSPETEADLRRGGYLPSQPDDMELWCNCTD